MLAGLPGLASPSERQSIQHQTAGTNNCSSAKLKRFHRSSHTRTADPRALHFTDEAGFSHQRSPNTGSVFPSRDAWRFVAPRPRPAIRGALPSPTMRERSTGHRQARGVATSPGWSARSRVVRPASLNLGTKPGRPALPAPSGRCRPQRWPRPAWEDDAQPRWPRLSLLYRAPRARGGASSPAGAPL